MPYTQTYAILLKRAIKGEQICPPSQGHSGRLNGIAVFFGGICEVGDDAFNPPDHLVQGLGLLFRM